MQHSLFSISNHCKYNLCESTMMYIDNNDCNRYES